MSAYPLYGIEVGQVYASIDGAHRRVTVRDVLRFASVGDVVVLDEATQEERRISAYRLAKVSHYLVDFNEGENRRALFKALHEGTATPEQQGRLAQLVLAMQNAMQEQQANVRRGHFMVDHGEWRYLDDEREGKRTWLCAKVAPDADLSCKGTRARELDAAIERLSKQADKGVLA